MMVKAYEELRQKGTISIENIPEELYHNYIRGNFNSMTMSGVLSVQIAKDGRVWICINGLAFIRFSPRPDGKMSKEK